MPRRRILHAVTAHLAPAATATPSEPAAATPPPSSERAVVVGGARTPFAKAFGDLAHLDAIALGVVAVKGLVEKLAIDPEIIDEVVFGNVVVNVAAPNVAREVVLDADLPRHISGTTVVCQCLSGLECVAQAARLVEAGDASCVVAGGSDSTSSGEIALDRSLGLVLGKYVMGGGNKEGMKGLMALLRGVAGAKKTPNQPSVAERSTGKTMGFHADLMAELNNVERDEQDSWAIESHLKATAARQAGLLAQEIVPAPAAGGDGDSVSLDGLIRETGMTAERLAKLGGVFRKPGQAEPDAGLDGNGAGRVTAASSSALTDGASAVLVMSESAASAAGQPTDIVVATYVKSSVDPYPQLLLAPAVAIPAALAKAGLTLDQIDVFEIHEAFSAQVLATLACLESEEFAKDWLPAEYGGKAVGTIPREKINPNGSSIGARLPVCLH